jgi:hypothetical protein
MTCRAKLHASGGRAHRMARKEYAPDRAITSDWLGLRKCKTIAPPLKAYALRERFPNAG